MEANELMIGDWVVYDGDVEYTNPIKVEGIDIATGALVTSDREDVGIDNIQPIPLTAEILEKIGFKKCPYKGIEGQHQWEWWKDTLTLVSIWTRGLYDDSRDGWMLRIESQLSSVCIKIECMHELQHALRLCGIEKEITL